MGTNYYWIPAERPVCPHCGRSDDREELHIGKSSAGWCFSLHVYPDKGILDLPDWESRWALGGTICDEYGHPVSPKAMKAVIVDREAISPDNWTPREYAANHAEPGPRNLARSKIDGAHCVGHGAGPWDLHIGDFS